MCNIFFLKNIICKDNAIFALRNQKVNYGVNHQMAKHLSVNRQISKPILAVKTKRLAGGKLSFLAELRRPEGSPSGAPYS